MDLAIRFGFGGAVTVTTELIARTFGPEIAGLFLAFPAILPASLTLIRQNEGREAAANDALGATLEASRFRSLQSASGKAGALTFALRRIFIQ